ncbi:MAG: PLP-dependent aminotransferase family protein [Chlorobia bacterium]|nr:PLP-dependent aminotransferase family protein [Fimbriimonadaceae bacterium]
MRDWSSFDRNRPEALHWQIAESMRSGILDGELRPGQRLPSVRELAKELGVHRLTVFKAYEELASSGLTQSKPGSGTFVASEFKRKATTEMLGRILGEGPMNRFEALSDEAGLRSLASNVPDPWLFRADEFLLECYELRKGSPWIFYYAPPAGAHELCRAVAEQLTSRGLQTSDSQIVITNGNSHSLSLALGLLAPSQEPVAIEDPMFLAAKAWFGQRGYRYLPIPRIESELDLGRLKSAVQKDMCKGLVVAPNFGQVTGWQMNVAERQRLVDTCRDLDCAIIELASTSLVSYDGDAPPALSNAEDDCQTIFIDDFSSSLSPGLRIGYMRLSHPQARQIETRMQSEQHSGVQFIQIALANFIERGLHKAHLERVIPRYRSRRDRMMSSLRMHMPTGVKWTQPQGGFSTWIEMPEGNYYGDLYIQALERGVAFSPGRMFTDRPDQDRFMRLSFGTQDPASIEEAVRILGSLVQAIAS